MAVDGLKKVGLTFKADGSVNFAKTINEINAQLQKNYQNLKLVQSEYDQNTSSTQKLTDKLAYLNDAYDLYSDRVKVLREDLAKLGEAEDKDSVAIEKKKTAIIQAETKLNNYGKQIDEISDKLKSGTANIEDFAKKLDESSKKLSDVGKTISIGSVAVAGLGAAALKTCTDFEYAMATVQATSGASSEDMKKLTAKAREMGETTKFSASESAEAMYYMALAGWKTEDMLNGISGMLNLAAASGEDLASVSDIVTDGLTALGYAASDSAKLADVFAATVTNSNTDVAKLGEAMKYVGSIAGALDINMEGVSLALGLMANSGVKASQAGTSLRSVLTRLAGDTDGCRSWLERLGVQIFDSKGTMRDFEVILSELRKKFANLSDAEKAANAQLLAGKPGMAGLLAIINASEEDFNKLSSAIDASAGAAKDMADIMNDTASGQITLLKSQIEGLAIQFGNIMLPVFKKTVEWLSKLMTWISKLSPETQRVITIIGATVAILGPLLIIIGKMGSGISTLITIFTTVIPAIIGFISALNPITIIVALVIAAVIALGIAIYKNWDSIVAWTKDFVEKVKNVFYGIINFIENIFTIDFSERFGAIGNIINAYIANFKNYFESWKQIFSGIIQFIKSVFTGDWKGAWEGIKKIFSGVFNMLYSIAVAPINLIIGALNIMLEGINKVIKGINKIKIPDWDVFGSLAGKGLNIPTIGKISYLAKGGDLLKGTAIVGEAGPEMLYNNGRSTKVLPLSNGGGATPVNIIDYEKLTQAFLKALAKCRLVFDKEGFIKIMLEELYEVM